MYKNQSLFNILHFVKSVRIRSFSGPHFLAFGLTTERYSVSLRIHSECGKMRTRIIPNTDTFYSMDANYFRQKFHHRCLSGSGIRLAVSNHETCKIMETFVFFGEITHPEGDSVTLKKNKEPVTSAILFLR